MQPDTIQWFPGHMAKTRRIMAECLPDVDIVLELLDARIPKASSNPEIQRLTEGKPLLKLLNKASLADPNATGAWQEYYKSRGFACLAIDCITGQGIREIPDAVRTVLAEKIERYAQKGMGGRHLRAMVVGIPNVGKSSLINCLASAKKVVVENRPGVTLKKQWISTRFGLELLDMPGVLWPKFESHSIGLSLAITGAIKDTILDLEEIACRLLDILRENYLERLRERYRITEEEEALPVYELFEAIGSHRGFLMAGGAIHNERTAKTLLDEFRRGLLGRISLEWPRRNEHA